MRRSRRCPTPRRHAPGCAIRSTGSLQPPDLRVATAVGTRPDAAAHPWRRVPRLRRGKRCRKKGVVDRPGFLGGFSPEPGPPACKAYAPHLRLGILPLDHRPCRFAITRLNIFCRRFDRSASQKRKASPKQHRQPRRPSTPDGRCIVRATGITNRDFLTGIIIPVG